MLFNNKSTTVSIYGNRDFINTTFNANDQIGLSKIYGYKIG